MKLNKKQMETVKNIAENVNESHGSYEEKKRTAEQFLEDIGFKNEELREDDIKNLAEKLFMTTKELKGILDVK
jgi:hypothetical protein